MEVELVLASVTGQLQRLVEDGLDPADAGLGALRVVLGLGLEKNTRKFKMALENIFQSRFIL